MEIITKKFDSLKNWFWDIACFTRIVAGVSALTGIFTIIFGVSQYLLMRTDDSSVNIAWKLFLYQFQSVSIIGVIFQVIVYLPIGSHTEKSLGTARYLMFFFSNCIIIGIFSLMFSKLISLIFRGQEDVSGLWGQLMMEIVIRYQYHDSNVHLCNSPASIPPKYIPILLLPFFLYFGCWTSTVVGMCLGYLRKS